jgi:hypothetical protein
MMDLNLLRLVPILAKEKRHAGRAQSQYYAIGIQPCAQSPARAA